MYDNIVSRFKFCINDIIVSPASKLHFIVIPGNMNFGRLKFQDAESGSDMICTGKYDSQSGTPTEANAVLHMLLFLFCRWEQMILEL